MVPLVQSAQYSGQARNCHADKAATNGDTYADKTATDGDTDGNPHADTRSSVAYARASLL